MPLRSCVKQRIAALGLVLFVGLLGASVRPAYATAVLWSSRSAWEASVTSFDTEDFETTPNPPSCFRWVPGLEFNSCAHEIIVDAPKLDFVFGVGSHPAFRVVDGGLVNGSREIQGDLHNSKSLVSLGPRYNRIEFPVPITAFGVDLTRFGFGTDPSASLEVLDQTFLIASGAQFIGITSTEPFSAFTLRGEEGEEALNFFYGFDHVTFSPIPEPSTALLLSAGLGTLAARRYKAL